MGYIDFLVENRVIDRNNILWWDLGYEEDPRELMGFDEFEQRLAGIGKYPLDSSGMDFDIRVYEGERVPVTVLDIDIEGNSIPLFVTARPVNPRELEHTFYDSYSRIVQDPWVFDRERLDYIDSLPPEARQDAATTMLREMVDAKGRWTGNIHFLPHVRGIVREIGDDRIFYHNVTGISSFYGGPLSLEGIQETLEYMGKPFVLASSWHVYLCDRTNLALEDIRKKGIIRETRTRSPRMGKGVVLQERVEWKGLIQVPYDEFDPSLEQDTVSYYPVMPSPQKASIPAAISNRTHPHGKERGAYFLGIFGFLSNDELYVTPVVSKEYAREACEELESKLGFGFRPVVFEKRPGRGRYRLLD